MAASPLVNDTGIRIELVNYHNSRPRLAYPPVDPGVSSNEWNTIAAANHRIEVIAIAVFNPLAYILVLYALTFTPVVYVAPTREVSVLITVLMGSFLLGEGDLRRRMIWATVILIGTVLLATG